MHRDCILTNNKLTWTLEADDKKISFVGRENAEYLAFIFSKLGYAITWKEVKDE